LISDNGSAVEQDISRAIADVARALAAGSAEDEQTSAAGRSYAEQFSWKNVAEEYLNCYNEVMNSHLGRDT